MSDEARIPGVVARPPLIYAGGLVAGAILDWIFPIAGPDWFGGTRRLAAVILAGLSLGLAFWAFAHFRRAGTNIPTNLPVNALVTDGPYRYSRNPIYLALTGAYLSITLWAASLWMLILLAPVLIVMNRGVIDREEALLEHLFGQQYRDYLARVRRWL